MGLSSIIRSGALRSKDANSARVPRFTDIFQKGIAEQAAMPFCTFVEISPLLPCGGERIPAMAWKFPIWSPEPFLHKIADYNSARATPLYCCTHSEKAIHRFLAKTYCVFHSGLDKLCCLCYTLVKIFTEVGFVAVCVKISNMNTFPMRGAHTGYWYVDGLGSLYSFLGI